MNFNSLERLKIAVSRKEVVCPMPPVWDDFYRLIGGFNDKRLVGVGPLILSSWNYTSDDEKNQRFMLHLCVAEENNMKDKTNRFFRSLDSKNSRVWLLYD